MSIVYINKAGVAHLRIWLCLVHHASVTGERFILPAASCHCLIPVCVLCCSGHVGGAEEHREVLCHQGSEEGCGAGG